LLALPALDPAFALPRAWGSARPACPLEESPMTTAIDDLDLDECARRALATGQLRKLADVLDADDPHHRLHIYVAVSDGRFGRGSEPARIATVDVLAAALGLTAEPSKDNGYWCHRAETQAGELYLKVYTGIQEPAARCACGAECTHTADGVR
jgi:hypothetical protein